MLCDRCGALMHSDGEYPGCTICGHEDYSATVSGAPVGSGRVPEVVEVDWLEYAGESRAFRGRRLALVLAVRQRGNMSGVEAVCPFECGQRMPKQGTDRVYGATYQCPERHRVHVKQTGADRGWK